jgi:hypothetical protein
MSIQTLEATIVADVKLWAGDIETEAEVVGGEFWTAFKSVVLALQPTLLAEFKTLADAALGQVGSGDLTGAETSVLNGASSDLKSVLQTLGSATIQILIGLVAKIE